MPKIGQILVKTPWPTIYFSTSTLWNPWFSCIPTYQ